MAFISKTGISTNSIIEASQITSIIDAFDGTTATQIFMSGPVTASNFKATGSMFGTFTGALSGNATTATTAGTATTATTASYAIKAQTAFTASLAVSSSYTVSASLSISSSYALSSSHSTTSISSSYAATASYSDYSAFTQVKTIPLIYSAYGSGSRLLAASGVTAITSTVLPIATLGFVGSTYVGSNIINPYAVATGAEPLYVKFTIAGSGSLGLNGGTAGVPYIVGPTEVINVDCYINSPSNQGGSPGLVNLNWNTNTTIGANSAYAYLWNNGLGPLYRVETAWASVDVNAFNNNSFLGMDLNVTNGTTKGMTIDNVTLHLALKKP